MTFYEILSVFATLLSLFTFSNYIKISNKFKTSINLINKSNGSNIINAKDVSIVNNGLDYFAVVKISQNTTKEELDKVIKKITELEKEASRGSKIYTSKEEPKDMKNGDIWIQPVEEIE